MGWALNLRTNALDSTTYSAFNTMNKPIIKDKAVLAYVDWLQGKLNVYETSPVVKSYTALLKQINHWNSQLESSDIDLFADKDEKGFDRTFKYFGEILPLHKTLKELRLLMTENEKKESDTLTTKEGNVLEQLMLEEKTNGKN